MSGEGDAAGILWRLVALVAVFLLLVALYDRLEASCEAKGGHPIDGPGVRVPVCVDDHGRRL